MAPAPVPSIRERLSSGDALAAIWITLDSPAAAESVASRGFDLAVLDMQHGLTHAGSILAMLQAVQGAGVPALVRVPANDPTPIGFALDVGADGVIVPLVEGAADAAGAVAACHYPPDGSRSYGPARASLRHGDPAAAARAAAVFVMIETRRALEDVDAIAATPGLTGLFVGPADLGYALGLGPQTDSQRPEHRQALETVMAACRRHGIASGIYSNDPKYARELAQRGMQLLVIASDASLLARSASACVEAWRSG